MVGDSGLPVAPTLVVSERRVAHGGLQAADTTEQRLRIEHNESVRLALESAQKCNKTSLYMRRCRAAAPLHPQSVEQRGRVPCVSPKGAGSNRSTGLGIVVGHAAEDDTAAGVAIIYRPSLLQLVEGSSRTGTIDESIDTHLEGRLLLADFVMPDMTEITLCCDYAYSTNHHVV